MLPLFRSPARRAPRLTVAFVASTLVLTGCNAASDVVGAVGDAASEAADLASEALDEIEAEGGGQAPGETGGGQGGEAQEPGGDAAPGAPGGDAGPGDDGGLGAPVDDFSGVGFNGPAMMRGSVSQLVVEVDVQQGVSFSQSALDHLVNTMRQVADKPGGVVLAGGNSFASDRTQWTTADMREVAKANRSTFSDGSSVSVYVLYLDGGFYSDGEQTSAIGVAYNASEFGLFPGRWEGLSLLGSNAAIERAVLVHEWGHLLGLVNIGYTSDIDHEDPDHPGHSRNQGSVMYYAIESTLIGQVFSGAPPDSFDEADLADLEGIRTGKYRG